MKPILAVLWDMDGTIIDSEQIAAEALRCTIKENGLPDLADLYVRFVGRSADVIYRTLVKEFGLSVDSITWERRKHYHYFAAANQIQLFSDAVDIFNKFEREGIRQAIVSNSDRAIMDMQLSKAGLCRPGMITVSRNDVRMGKPDPEGYLRAAWLLNAPPEQCLVIEDSPSGAAAGLAAGMHTVFVSHAILTTPNGVTKLETMSDLARMVLKNNSRSNQISGEQID